MKISVRGIVTGAISAVTGLALSSVASLAHHGWGGYDAENPITVEGVVTHVQYENSHVHVAVPQSAKAWALTLAPVSRMELRGAVRDLLKPGKTVVAYGYKSKTNANEIRAERITIDGKTFELR